MRDVRLCFWFSLVAPWRRASGCRAENKKPSLSPRSPRKQETKSVSAKPYEEKYRRDRFVTGHEEMFEAADTRADEHEYESALKRMQEAVKGMLGHLDERERKIIISRFGLGGASEQTLEQLGRELGITKERVRQIESRAQDKLRKIAGEEKLDLPMF
ncbi:MAG: sigma-70 family RNA polymerase sigma factor [Isosphaeraceae bacterium]